MTEQRRSNLNTWIVSVGFVITIAGYIFSFGSMSARIEGSLTALHARDAAIEKAIESTSAAMNNALASRTTQRDAQMDRYEARMRAVEIAQASQSSDLRAIQSSLTRIEAAVERLQPKP